MYIICILIQGIKQLGVDGGAGYRRCYGDALAAPIHGRGRYCSHLRPRCCLDCAFRYGWNGDGTDHELTRSNYTYLKCSVVSFVHCKSTGSYMVRFTQFVECLTIYTVLM